MNVFLKNYDHS